MNSENIIRDFNLADGIRVVINDVSSHYYGGYYHVRLHVTAEVPLCGEWFVSVSEYDDAVRRLGATVCFIRTLEKMAVPAAEVDAVRSRLLESFETNVLSYLLRPDFPSRFVLSEYGKVCKSPVTNTYYRS